MTNNTSGSFIKLLNPDSTDDQKKYNPPKFPDLKFPPYPSQTDTNTSIDTSTDNSWPFKGIQKLNHHEPKRKKTVSPKKKKSISSSLLQKYKNILKAYDYSIFKTQLERREILKEMSVRNSGHVIDILLSLTRYYKEINKTPIALIYEEDANWLKSTIPPKWVKPPKKNNHT